MRRLFLALALALVALLPVAGQPAAASVDRSAGWIVGCRFSHRSTDDPIVMRFLQEELARNPRFVPRAAGRACA